MSTRAAFTTLAVTVTTALALTGAAGAQPSEAAQQRCLDNARKGRQVCLQVWTEQTFGSFTVKAKPSGDYDYYRLTITNDAGKTRTETAARAAIFGDIRTVDLGRSTRITISTVGVNDDWIRHGNDRSDTLTFSWPN